MVFTGLEEGTVRGLLPPNGGRVICRCQAGELPWLLVIHLVTEGNASSKSLELDHPSGDKHHPPVPPLPPQHTAGMLQLSQCVYPLDKHSLQACTAPGPGLDTPLPGISQMPWGLMGKTCTVNPGPAVSSGPGWKGPECPTLEWGRILETMEAIKCYKTERRQE